MTPQEINERIAKLCGWFPVEDTESGLWHLSNMDGRKIGYRSALSENHAWRVLCPDYYHSLDACATFETSIETQDYIHQLHMIMPICKLTLAADPSLWILAYLKTAPPQRCEAFLRMKGQWE